MESESELLKLKEICFKKNYDSLPLYPRIVTHKISIRLVMLLKDTYVTPNQITLFAYFLAFLAGIFFTVSGKWMFFLGALFLESYYVFDAVDGQLARYKKMSSQTGAWFDFVGNYIVHPYIFFCIGIGVFRYTGMFSGIVFSGMAAMSISILYAVSDTQSVLLLDKIRQNPNYENKKNEVFCSKSEPNVIKYIFSSLHRVCTYPPIMNVISVVAIVNLFTKIYLPYVLIVFYGVAVSFVWMCKIAFIIMTNKLDKNSE